MRSIFITIALLLTCLFIFNGCGSTSTPSSNYASGWAIGEELVGGYGYIIRTTDNGQTWTRQGDSTQLSNYLISDVCAFNSQIAWICGNHSNSPFIFKTTNGGTTWQTQTLPASISSQPLIRLTVVDQNVVWACGYQGLILRTVDGGSSWEVRSYPSTEASLVSIAAKDGTSAVVGGYLGNFDLPLMIYTADGGQHWSEPSVKPANCFVNEASWAPDSNTIWAAGSPTTVSSTYGYIYVSRDGGTTWESKVNLSYEPLAVLALSSDRVWVGGNSGGIHYTTTGGTTWETATAPNSIDIGGISAVSNTEIWMAGYETHTLFGHIIHSTNGGASWEDKTTPSPTDLTLLSRISMHR
ncbi:MAG: YCF48-related protein [Candidatus Saganbacteria bacterium]|nr:YCF48-related protein [Candidatus Saganbacteria bacterium]